MLTLKNTQKRIQVFNLPCKATPCGGTDCLCTLVEQRWPAETVDGRHGIKIVEKRIPGSLTLLAGETKSGIPDWVANCPAVKGALDRRDLKLIKG